MEKNWNEDWVECALGDIVIYSKGKKPKVLNNEKTKDLNIPYINIKAFEKGIYDEYTDGFKCNLCNDGDLLMVWDGARSGLTGRAKKGAVGSTLMKIEPSSSFINKEYLYYFLSSKYVLLNTNPRGVGIPHVEPNLLWNSKFIIHNIPIQRAIVAKIEELFSSLDSAIADLTKAQKQLVIYRQAVLKKAFEGELTKEWREKNKVTFNWEKTITGEVMPDISSGSTPKAEFLFKEGEIQFLKVYNLNFDGTLNKDKDPAFTTYKIHSTANRRAISKAGDVLINIVGPPLGKCSMIPLNCKVEFNINQAIVRFRPNDKILPKFLSFFLQNPETINWLEGTSKATAGQFNIKVTTCRVIPISLPTLNEQHQIVREIESRLSVCDKVEESIVESLEKAKALRQSILKKAFEGKLLTEEEIEKCKQEKDYEPASKLLERIKGEKKK